MVDLDLRGKRVMIREDLNVPVKDGKVTSDARIRATLPTLKWALDQGARVMVLSHLGRPEEGVWSEEVSLAPVAAHLSELLGQKVPLIKNWLDGVDVARLVQSTGRLPVGDAVEIALQAATGLAHLHGQGIVHRDVKPSNLMLTSEGIVKILDLGLALTTEAAGRPDGRLTGITYLGTHDYMAPEQWVDATSVTAKVDCYGLGCVLFQMLSGKTPFGGPKMSPQAKMKAHLERPTPVLPDRGDVPPALVRLMNRMLAKDPALRPAAADIAAELTSLRGAHRLVRLLELSRFAPVSGFTDGEPTNEAPLLPDEPSLPTLPRTPIRERGSPLQWFILGLLTTLALVATGWGLSRWWGV